MPTLERPKQIYYAVYFGIASYCLGLAIVLTQWSEGVQANGLEKQITALLVPFLIFFILYYFAFHRKNWAKILLLMLLGVMFVAYGLSIFGAKTMLLQYAQLLQLVLAAGSFSMFISDASKFWYKQI